MILTAADHKFARTLAQFLLSAERQGEHCRSRWEIYDLGLSVADRVLLKERFGWAELRSVDLGGYPRHVAVASGSYSWKPILIAAAAKQAEGPMFWFDSGTILKAPLDRALAALKTQGFWGLRSQLPLGLKCDPRVLEALLVPPEVRHVREYAAGAVGFDLDTMLGRRLVEDWGHHALIPAHIAPEDYAPFHKHDQALLNCLLANAMFGGQFEPTLEEIDISSAAPTTSVSTRNFVSNSIPLWADPAVRSMRSVAKTVDRLYHRIRHLDDTRIDGWRRRRKEHFSIHLLDADKAEEVAIQGPPGGYYADPFIWQRDDRNWVFVEEFVYARDRGQLTVLELGHDLTVASAQPLEFTPGYAALDTHASFPFTFDHEGETYMIPETHERRAVDLFVCDRWPSRWRLVRRLLSGVDAVDTMALREDGTWYLVTSTRGAWPNRHLEIYHSTDLLSGRFDPHPINAQGLYGTSQFGTGRNAGIISRNADGALVRLMQNSQNYYGEGLQPMRVIALTPELFAETPAPSIDCLPNIQTGFPSHHISISNSLICYDSRDRAK